jgi:hypothetical protein
MGTSPESEMVTFLEGVPEEEPTASTLYTTSRPSTYPAQADPLKSKSWKTFFSLYFIGSRVGNQVLSRAAGQLDSTAAQPHLDDAPEHHVLAVQPRRLDRGQEKLRARK